MKADEVIKKIQLEKNFKPNYSQLGEILNISRQSIGYYKTKDFPEDHLKKFEDHFCISFTKSKTGKVGDIQINTISDDCIDIPVKGDVHASMGYGITVYNENQTGTYKVGRKLVRDIGASENHLEMIFAEGDSMLPDIRSGDALIVDHSKKEVYDGKIYCVRIEGKAYAKRLQKIPPSTVKVISDNTKKYDAFYIDFSNKIDFDFEVLGQVCWSGRVLI